MNTVSVQNDKIEMILKQLGASVQSIHGILSYVKFQLGDTMVSYVYNINAKNQFFLQRVTPYPLGFGTYSTQNEVVNSIRQDIKQFITASNSRDFQKFMDLGFRTHRTMHLLDELFLNYNVPVEKMDEINKHLEDIQKIVGEVAVKYPEVKSDD